MKVPFKAKTIRDAKECFEMFTDKNSNRYKHVLAVVKNSHELASTLQLSEEEKFLFIASAYLHEIGYSEQLNKLSFHPVDSFNYLINNEWPYEVCLLVLHHTESECYPYRSEGDINTIYNSNPMLTSVDEIYKLLSIADMTADYDGEVVSPLVRYSNAVERYGEDSDQALHMGLVLLKMTVWIQNINLERKGKL